jgi:hypothetical protein
VFYLVYLEVKPAVKYIQVLNYGDSIIERLTSVFEETVKKVNFRYDFSNDLTYLGLPRYQS